MYIFLSVINAAQFSGFPATSKLLIVHADDLGMCHSVNQATISALEAGAITSASVMVPCAEFCEAAKWGARHPEYDIGIHSTLISEWKNSRWGPVSEGLHSAGLVDEDGHFWPKNSLLQASAAEIEAEISAQVMRARDSGLNPTHLDSHMLSVARPEYIVPYVKTARKFSLPFLIDEYWHSLLSPEDRSTDDVVMGHLFQAQARMSIDALDDYYISVLDELDSGLSQLIVHLGSDDKELRDITSNCQAYGAAWRQRDFEIVMGERFRSAVRKNGIQLVNWGMIYSARDTSAMPHAEHRAV